MNEQTPEGKNVPCSAWLGRPDTGDKVLHRPSGEEWLVGVVDGEYLYPLGWPPGRALVADCELLRKASGEDRLMWLRDMAQPRNMQWWRDDRHRIAVRILADMPNAQVQPTAKRSVAGRLEPLVRTDLENEP